MEAQCHDSPIFVVGASRSGTELMRSILNQHPSVCISPETHYFDDLRVKLRGRERQGLTRTEARKCEDHFLAALHRPYGHGGQPEKAPLSREALRETAVKIGTGADAFFEAFCRINASEKGADRWGEKTPRHVFCLPEILGAFPRSKVICMVRDPRGVVASYRALTNTKSLVHDIELEGKSALEQEQRRIRRSYNILIACLLWSGSVQAALDARRRFTADRVFIQRYENLVLDPPSALARLTAWLSIYYCPAMLNASITNSSYVSFQGAPGFAKPFIDRWRTNLSRHEIAVIQTACRRVMRCAGYQLEPIDTLLRPLLWECLKLPAAAIIAAVANRARIGAIGPYLYRRIRFACGSRRETDELRTSDFW
jgi:hypothetical protein